MKQRLLIRKYGNLIEISPDGKSPLPHNVLACLEPLLTYTYKKYVRGKEAREMFKRPSGVLTQPRRLFSIDRYGRLVCGAGLFQKISQCLEQNNFSVVFNNCDPIPASPDLFTPRWDLLSQGFRFRPKQLDFINSLLPECYACVQAPPAFGKSTLLGVICSILPLPKIDICAKSSDLVADIRHDLLGFVPNVGQVGAGKKERSRVTVYTADSLHLSDGNSDLFIGDEAHELMADSYVREIAKYRFARMWALSATLTGRSDGCDARMEAIFGPVKFNLSYDEAVQLGIILPIRVEWHDIIMPNPIAELSDPLARERHGIWRNERRNAQIAKVANSFEHDQVLIIVRSLEHAVYLKKHLPDFTLVFAQNDNADNDFDWYKRKGLLDESEPNMTAKRRALLKQQFKSGQLRKAISTYVWDTGADFPQLGVVIRADSKDTAIKDMQAPGRVCRRCDATGKTYGLVVDFFDMFDNSFYRKCLNRKRRYEAVNWEQTRNGGLLI